LKLSNLVVLHSEVDSLIWWGKKNKKKNRKKKEARMKSAWFFVLMACLLALDSSIVSAESSSAAFIGRNVGATRATSVARSRPVHHYVLNHKQRDGRNFIDIWPYLGNVLFKNAVRRIIIQPMLGGARRMVPHQIFITYNDLSQKYADHKLYRIVAPLQPVLSTYVNNKIESGVVWGIKKGFEVFVDNFIEFQ